VILSGCSLRLNGHADRQKDVLKLKLFFRFDIPLTNFANKIFFIKNFIFKNSYA
jgi:hypothetical protein